MNFFENCELVFEELIIIERFICKELRMNMIIILVNNLFSGDDMLLKYIVLIFLFVGIIVVILNLIVIVIVYLLKELW